MSTLFKENYVTILDSDDQHLGVDGSKYTMYTCKSCGNKIFININVCDEEQRRVGYKEIHFLPEDWGLYDFGVLCPYCKSVYLKFMKDTMNFEPNERR